MIMPKTNEFEITVLSVDGGVRSIFCFPHGGEGQAEAVARKLSADDCRNCLYYSDRHIIPLLITADGGRLLVLRSLLVVDCILPVIDPDSPHWCELDLSRIPMDVLRFDEDGDHELIMYNGESLNSGNGTGANDPFTRLACCTAESGCMTEVADSICALAEIMGCGLELTCASDDGCRDVAIGVAAAMALYMLMLCLRAGADRSCRARIDRLDGEVAVSIEFELCPDEFCPPDGEEWAEITACRRLADAHNVSFVFRVEQSGVWARFCPMCREWSRMGIKLPHGLEYD